MSEIPKVHFFICINEKESGKKSCLINDNLDPLAFSKKLKEECGNRWGKQVRINKAGCLGKCSSGVAAVLYPQGKWYFQLTEDEFKTILNDIEQNLADSP